MTNALYIHRRRIAWWDTDAADDRLSFEGKFVCVFVDGKTGKPTRIPVQFREAVAR